MGNIEEILNKHHLTKGDKLVWYNNPDMIATWNQNGTVDIADKTNVSMCSATFYAKNGHWRNKDEHGVGKELEHWLYCGYTLQEILQCKSDFLGQKNTTSKAAISKDEQSNKTKNIVTKKVSKNNLHNNTKKEKFGDNVEKGKDKYTETPANIASDMIKMLSDVEPDEDGIYDDDEVFNKDSKYLDIACKSGIFLKCIRDRLMHTRDLVNEFPNIDDRRNHINNKQLFGIALNQDCADKSRITLYEVTYIEGNIQAADKYLTKDNVKLADSYENLIKPIKGKSEIPKEELKTKIEKFRTLIERIFNIEMGMQIDVVVGNPPYNNDIYIPFVMLGHEIASKCTCMITPAKWQAKGGELNENFRKTVVPYMAKAVVYKDSTDVFDIEEWGGISYFIINKEEYSRKLVKAVCKSNNIFNTNNFEEHDENSISLYSRELLKIIGKVGMLGEGFKQSLYVKNTDHGEESIADTLGFKRCIFTGEQERGESTKKHDYVEVMQGEKVVGYKKKSDLFTQLNLDKYKVICSIMPGAVAKFDANGQVLGMFKLSIIGPDQVPKGSFPVLKYFDTYDECKSFESYMYTRLAAFLYYLGTCGTTLTKEFFRFLPDPITFDKIFEDKPLEGYTPDENGEYIDSNGNKHCSLYIKYKLTEEEINIIESVIKPRT